MKLLLYCTKAKPYLYYAQESRTLMEIDNSFEGYKTTNKNVDDTLNGKIVAECDFEVERLQIVYGKGWETKTIKGTENIEKLTCLSRDELYQYCKGNGYAIHIKNLHIFDKPRELEDYEDEWEYPLEKAPQNMRICYSTLYSNIEADMPIKTDSYILTSIKPEWLCKILNGEKTIEVRNKVLKEMLE